MASADAVTAAFKAKANRKGAAIAVNLTGKLAVVTPKDTTNASRCWIPSRGVPVLLDKADPVRQGAGVADLVGVGVSLGTYFVGNGAGYIQRLNGGSSDQEPAGFVQRAIAEVIQEEGGSARRLSSLPGGFR